VYLFRCRNLEDTVYPLVEILEDLNHQLDLLCELRFAEDELQYLRSLRFIKSDFVDYLELFQLKRRFIQASIDESGRLDIRIEGPMVQAMMFEIFVLAIVTFVSLNKNFTQPITQISQQMAFVVQATAGAGRMFDLLDQKPETDEGYVEFVNAKYNLNGELEECKERTGIWAWKHRHQADGTVDYKKMEGEVVFDGVDFGYDDSKIVLHDVKLFAKPGQKIAFVGSTGAGKTTITNLINRFYDIQDGKIRYDGINITKIKKPALRKTLGIVLQDTHLFTGTVMENIRYGNLDATDEECMAAARLANANGFIERLPDGYNTVLTGDGSNLSQDRRLPLLQWL
jgi:ABC-type multidrug transport system fused ATPase/permease subunit